MAARKVGSKRKRVNGVAKKPEIDEWSGLPVQPFVQLDTPPEWMYTDPARRDAYLRKAGVLADDGDGKKAARKKTTRKSTSKKPKSGK